MKRKNADYGGDVDALRNFRMHGLLGITVRLHDKLCRLETAGRQELQVSEETAEDTAIDVINYAVLWLAMYRESRPEAIAKKLAAKAGWPTEPTAGPEDHHRRPME